MRIKHGNITLETVVARQRSKGLEIKLSSFDQAIVFKEPNRKVSSSLLVLTQKIAMQVNDETTLSKTSDILDIGVLAYLLLSDVTQNDASEIRTVLSCCQDKETIFQGGQWHKVSRECKELISLMIDEDPRQRLSVDQVMAHPWF